MANGRVALFTSHGRVSITGRDVYRPPVRRPLAWLLGKTLLDTPSSWPTKTIVYRTDNEWCLYHPAISSPATERHQVIHSFIHLFKDPRRTSGEFIFMFKSYVDFVESHVKHFNNLLCNTRQACL